MAGACERGDEPPLSGAMEFVGSWYMYDNIQPYIGLQSMSLEPLFILVFRHLTARDR